MFYSFAFPSKDEITFFREIVSNLDPVKHGAISRFSFHDIESAGKQTCAGAESDFTLEKFT